MGRRERLERIHQKQSITSAWWGMMFSCRTPTRAHGIDITSTTDTSFHQRSLSSSFLINLSMSKRTQSRSFAGTSYLRPLKTFFYIVYQFCKWLKTALFVGENTGPGREHLYFKWCYINILLQSWRTSVPAVSLERFLFLSFIGHCSCLIRIPVYWTLKISLSRITERNFAINHLEL